MKNIIPWANIHEFLAQIGISSELIQDADISLAIHGNKVVITADWSMTFDVLNKNFIITGESS